MNELKEIFIVEGHYTENSPAPLFGDCLGYGKEEVDALLAKKDKEIAELKAEIKRKEGVQHRWFKRCMQARAENVELKRKLAEKSEKILELQKASDVALSKVYALLDEIKSLKASCPDLPPVEMPPPQRWMTAANPPQNMREVLICAQIRGHLAVCLGHYNYSKKQWFLHDQYSPTEVAYWSEKPYPPEEVKEASK